MALLRRTKCYASSGWTGLLWEYSHLRANSKGFRKNYKQVLVQNDELCLMCNFVGCEPYAIKTKDCIIGQIQIGILSLCSAVDLNFDLFQTFIK